MNDLVVGRGVDMRNDGGHLSLSLLLSGGGASDSLLTET